MGGYLIVQRGGEIGRRVALAAPAVTIGRGRDNDLVLGDPTVSRYHAVIRCDGGRCAVTDLGAANPVVVNERALAPGRAQPLGDGDVLLLGRAALAYRGGGAPAARPARLSLAGWRALVGRGAAAPRPPGGQRPPSE